MSDTTNPPGAAPTQQFITFTLGAGEYGVDIMAVREIKGWSETTAIPNAPRFINGVINLRGIIVPIMDLRARFGMEPSHAHADERGDHHQHRRAHHRATCRCGIGHHLDHRRRHQADPRHGQRYTRKPVGRTSSNE